MTDAEFAVRIYCEVFQVETDDGDAYTQGILGAISLLEPRKRIALESRFRHGNKFKQVAADMGIKSAAAASQALNAALRQLRCQPLNLSVARLILHKDRQLEVAAAIQKGNGFFLLR